MSTERLDKLIATQKNLPRKETRQIISRARVTVNGVVARAFDTRVNPEIDVIELDGQRVDYKKYVYIMMNKPKGVLSAATDKSRSTVVDLVPEELSRKELFPVGRLDKDTTGLLLITDDGEFAHRVISPKSEIEKVYEVVLDGELPDNAEELFLKGIVLHDGTRCLPAKLTIDKNDKTRAEVTIMEGKYHQIKRMFGVLSLGVVELHRKSVGGVELDPRLSLGECRLLNAEELAKINKGNSNTDNK